MNRAGPSRLAQTFASRAWSRTLRWRSAGEGFACGMSPSWMFCEPRVEAPTEMWANAGGPDALAADPDEPGRVQHVDGVVAGLLQCGPGAPTHGATLRARDRPADERALDRLDGRDGAGGGPGARGDWPGGHGRGTERGGQGASLQIEHTVTLLREIREQSSTASSEHSYRSSVACHTQLADPGGHGQSQPRGAERRATADGGRLGQSRGCLSRSGGAGLDSSRARH